MKPIDTDDEPDALRLQYEKYGVEGYYSAFGAGYRNPHEPVIRRLLGSVVEKWRPDLSSVLDLACGSGEVTLALRDLGAGLGAVKISGIDPHTGEAFFERTGEQAEALSFEQIATGALEGRRYSLIVCSFALHLMDESWLPALLAALLMASDTLLILTPHKRPEIRREWGWLMTDEMIIDRVRARQYKGMILT